MKKKEVDRLEELKRHNEAQARLHVYAESIEADEGKMRSVPPLQHKQEDYLSQPNFSQPNQPSYSPQRFPVT